MITEQTTMKPVPWKCGPAIEIARQCYRRWKSDIPFHEDLADYLRTGIVIARPDIFGMAKIIEYQGQPAWFVRMAVGDLRTLVAELPAYFPKIIFCRRNDRRGRVYSFDRFMQLALKGG